MYCGRNVHIEPLWQRTLALHTSQSTNYDASTHFESKRCLPSRELCLQQTTITPQRLLSYTKANLLPEESRLTKSVRIRSVGQRSVNPLSSIAVPKVAPGLKISATEKAPYIVVCLDLDAPFVKTPFLSPIVHWIQSGLNAGAGEDALLQSQVSPIVNWLPPSPPPISGPHRYLFMVFAQPSDFDLTRWNAAFKKPVSTWSRVRWNIDQFVQEAGLEDIVAATFFGSV